LGRALVEELVAAGAKKVYGAARDPQTFTTAGVVAVKLDVTKPGEVAAGLLSPRDRGPNWAAREPK